MLEIRGEPFHSWDLRYEMPQTVPSAGFTPPCDYSNFAADCFDLSLLPSPDGEVPYSPVSLHQVMSFYSDPTTSPPSMFPSGGPDECPSSRGLKQSEADVAGAAGEAAPGAYAAETYRFVKEEPFSTGYLPSPAPPSPAGGPVPAFQRSSTPVVKTEQNLDLQDILHESRFLQETVAKQEESRLSCEKATKYMPPSLSFAMSPPEEQPPVVAGDAGSGPAQGPAAAGSSGADHRLLREVLRDTSFQRRYNLKPFDFAGLAPGFVAGAGSPPAAPATHTPPPPPAVPVVPPPPPPHEVKLEDGEALQLSRERMEPVLSLAIEQLRKDVGDTCSLLGISPDPSRWTAGDVRSWLLWTLRQYALPMIPIEYFAMDGAALAALSEHDFQQRAPQCGSTLYAQLEIWKAACQDLDIQWTNSSTSSSSPREDPSDADDDEEDDEPRDATVSEGAVAGTSGAGPIRPTGARAGSSGGGSGGGAHIHLWQFLKELLAAPQLHGSCIRWLDRPKGVFKIEDSVRVARLWGKRKNRPAMNYDKLSRSIRQYYKKGIMKKTERSQRLVYQFCHPYSL